MTSAPQPSPISRRTVTAGLAWAAPVVAVTAAAPAFAASRLDCTPSPRSSAGLYSLLPTDPGYDPAWMEYRISFGRVWVYGLDPLVNGAPSQTVTSITTTYYMADDDFRWLNNPDGRGNGGQIRLSNGDWTAASGTSATFSFWDSMNTGLGSNQVSYDQNGAINSTGPVPSDRSNGTTLKVDTPHNYTSYTNTWTPADGTQPFRTAEYSTDSNGCTIFVLPELGEFSFREPRATTLYNDERWRDWTEYTVTLSDGTVLRWSTWDPRYTPGYGTSDHIIY